MNIEQGQMILNQFGNKYVNPQFKGEGAFSKVYKCQNQKGEFVAIKVVNLINIKPAIIPYLRNEIYLLQQSDNNNVIKLYESLETESALFLVLEYCEFDIMGIMRIYFKNKIPEYIVIVILQQMVNGLHYLHKNKIIHRDLKLENIGIMIAPEDLHLLNNCNKNDCENVFKNATYKIIDFGLSKQFQNQTQTVTFAGTQVNMAPEVLQRKPYSFEADIYSLGVCLYQMITGQYPYYDKTQQKEQLELIKQQDASFEQINDQNLKNIIQRMLKYEVEDRLTFQQLYQEQLLYNTKSQQLKKSLINKSEFYILDRPISIQSNYQSMDIKQNFESQNRQQILEEGKSQNFQNQFFEKLNNSHNFNQFRNPLKQSQIGKPKSKIQSNQNMENDLQYQSQNYLDNQIALTSKICEKLNDLIQNIPKIFTYYSFQGEFIEYLNYFQDLIQLMRSQTNNQIPEYQQGNVELNQNRSLSKTLYEFRKISKQVSSLKEIKDLSNSQNDLLFNNVIIYSQTLKILQDIYHKEKDINIQNENIIRFNCNIYMILINLAKLRVTYNQQHLPDNFTCESNLNFQLNPEQLCQQLTQIIDQYQLTFLEND